MNKQPHKENRLPTSKHWKHIQWTYGATNIDDETGEIITKKQIQNEGYIKIHTDHLDTISQKQPKGHREYITRWKKSPQLRIF